jgi:segregation and condensation protein B
MVIGVCEKACNCGKINSFAQIMASAPEDSILLAQAEALLFAADKPVPLTELCRLLGQYHQCEIEEQSLETLLEQLQNQYAARTGGFELRMAGGGYAFYTKPDYHDLLAMAVAERSKKRLSTAALETLSIIAYKQPVTKTELEAIRGVSCDYSIQRLLEKNLIAIKGKSDGPGRPTLYATSDFFMEYFGINGLHELPQLKELQGEGSEIGGEETA